MKHFYRICFVLLAYAALVSLFHALRPKPPSKSSNAGLAETMTDRPNRITSSDPLYDQLIVNRVGALKDMARYREHLAHAAQNMLKTRRQAAGEAYAPWNQVIQTNKQTYLKLLEKALHEPHGQTPCTICDGFSYMPCVMCKNHDGKCITCGGSGHDVGREFCPSCFGKGKCYLCNGNGKMFCPFCDDGMIKVQWSPPKTLPPLE